MLEIDWDSTDGWHSPRIIPYQNLSLSPACTALHYGIEVRGTKSFLYPLISALLTISFLYIVL